MGRETSFTWRKVVERVAVECGTSPMLQGSHPVGAALRLPFTSGPEGRQ